MQFRISGVSRRAVFCRGKDGGEKPCLQQKPHRLVRRAQSKRLTLGNKCALWSQAVATFVQLQCALDAISSTGYDHVHSLRVQATTNLRVPPCVRRLSRFERNDWFRLAVHRTQQDFTDGMTTGTTHALRSFFSDTDAGTVGDGSDKSIRTAQCKTFEAVFRT